MRSEFVKNFSPSWFACIMGTGIFAITSSFYSNYVPFLRYVSYVLFYLNIVMFFIFLVPWVLRWIFFKEECLKDLHHPVTSNFYATIAIGMLVLSADFMNIGKSVFLGEIFWFIGTPITILFSVLIPYIVFKHEGVEIDHVNPAWFIPPVGLIVIPIAGSLLIDEFSGFMRELVLVLNFFGWGAGFFLYLALHAISMYRFALHKPLPSVLAPTVWINLGPVGAGTVALINLVEHSGLVESESAFLTFGFIFWGFGIWWLVMAIVMTLHYMRKRELKFALSWWAFTFPLGAYVASSHVISKIFDLRIVDHIGFTLYWLLAFIWILTFVNTMKSVFFRAQ